jgi:ribosomal protein L11 methylase PrmA
LVPHDECSQQNLAARGLLTLADVPGGAHPAAGSFRDPQGQVIECGDHIYRALHAPLAPFPATWSDTGPLAELVRSGKVWPARPLERDDVPPAALSLAPADTVGFLEHPRLAPITYPYEWPFLLLKRAALLHLGVHRDVLKRGLTLSDGSAYNVQFIGTRPVFLDSLAFVPYVEGQPWAGYTQFCETFLNPLLMAAMGSTAQLDLYRGNLRGITCREMSRQLGWLGALRFGVFMHVTVNAMAGAGTGRAPTSRRPRLSRAGLDLLLASLERAIVRIELPKARAGWSTYESDNSYSARQRTEKHAAVHAFVARTRPALLLDIGCNAGEYAESALKAGATQVVGIERDGAAVNDAVARADRLAQPFLPLQMDVQNLSPSQGWNFAERVSLTERVKPDALMCLALLHHLVLGEGLPLDMVVRTFVSMAPRGIIEFIPPEDAMARQIAGPPERLRHRYDLPAFLASLSAVARIEQQTLLTDGGRVLVAYWSER